MATRVLNFSRAHPNESEGHVAALSRLEAIVARAEQVAIQQRDGISEVRASTRQKEELRRSIRRTQLLHLSRVAEAAGKERPELEQKFVLAPEGTPYLAFRAAARGIAAEAQNEKDLLLKHGLLETAPRVSPRRSSSSIARSSGAPAAGRPTSVPGPSSRRSRTRLSRWCG